MIKKFLATAAAFIYLTVAAWAYGPVGNGVYKGFVINNNTNRYIVVEIYKKGEEMPVFQKQINPQRPPEMTWKKWGEGFIPDLHAYKKLLEKYYDDYGHPLWIQEVYLYPNVVYTIKFKYSDEEKFKEDVFIFFEEDAKEGPYLIEIE